MNVAARYTIVTLRKLRAFSMRWGVQPGPVPLSMIRQSYRAWRDTVGTWN